MAGRVQNFNNNECDHIHTETVIENVLHCLSLTKKDVAIFASWHEIELADESILGSVYDNTGNKASHFIKSSCFFKFFNIH